MRRQQQLVAGVYKTIRVVGKSSIHAYVGVQKPSLMESVVYGRLRFHAYKSVQLVRCGDMLTSKKLSQLNVIVLKSGSFTWR